VPSVRQLARHSPGAVAEVAHVVLPATTSARHGDFGQANRVGFERARRVLHLTGLELRGDRTSLHRGHAVAEAGRGASGSIHAASTP
jgi:hypothetical protein